MVHSKKRRIGPRMVVIKPELKYFDKVVNASNLSLMAATGEIIGLNDTIINGSGVSNVIGNHITVKQIEINMTFWLNQIATTTFASAKDKNWFHVALVLDTQANGQMATLANVFTGTSTEAMINPANEQRFRILKQKGFTQNAQTMAINGTNWTAFAAQPIDLRWKIKCNIRLDYGSPAGNIAQVRSNNLMIMIRSLGDDATTRGNYHTRIRYTDV